MTERVAAKNRKALVYWAPLILGLLVICLVVVAVTGVTIEEADTSLTPTPAPIVRRYIDDDAGVVCYIVTRGIPTAAWGISCLPIGDTRLGDDGR